MRYVHVRFPQIAYENLNNKRKKVEQTLFQITGKKIRVPLTKVLTALTENETKINDDYLINLFNRRRGRPKL